MKLRSSVLTKTVVSLGGLAVLLALAACAGGGSSSASAAAPVTQSNITLPSSVQVVTATN